MVEGFHINQISEKEQPTRIQLDFNVVFVKKGNCSVILGDKLLDVKTGQVALLYPYTLFSTKSCENSECYLITFPYSLTKEIYLTSKKKTAYGYVLSLPTETYKYVDLLLNDNCLSNDYKTKSLYYAIINEFLNGYSKENHSNNGFLPKIIDLIRSGTIENMTISKVSDYLGVSRSFLVTYLKKHTDLTFKDFVNNVIVGKSVELLYDKDLSITEIAIKSGFGSLRSFNRVFASKMGCTPTQYRKKMYS